MVPVQPDDVEHPLVGNDLIELDIKFLQVLEKDHLDNIFVALVLIFVGIAIDRAMEFRRSANAIQASEQQLEDAVLQFVETMAQALDARDKYTAGHSERVSINSCTIAEAMDVASNEVEVIRIGARLHDIGKIGIPDCSRVSSIYLPNPVNTNNPSLAIRLIAHIN